MKKKNNGKNLIFEEMERCSEDKGINHIIDSIVCFGDIGSGRMISTQSVLEAYFMKMLKNRASIGDKGRQQSCVK